MDFPVKFPSLLTIPKESVHGITMLLLIWFFCVSAWCILEQSHSSRSWTMHWSILSIQVLHYGNEPLPCTVLCIDISNSLIWLGAYDKLLLKRNCTLYIIECDLTVVWVLLVHCYSGFTVSTRTGDSCGNDSWNDCLAATDRPREGKQEWTCST